MTNEDGMATPNGQPVLGMDDATERRDLLTPVRRAKHWVFVFRKRGRRRFLEAKFSTATRIFQNGDRRPWTYRPKRYVDTFLRHDHFMVEESRFPPRTFVVWTGVNALTPNRSRNLMRLQNELGIPVQLVTPETLGEWIVPGYPLHPAFEHLSLIHRSDYLRGYLMHHYGGGYSDIKAPVGSWSAPFDAMAADPDVWVTSFRATDANWIGKYRGRMGLDILTRYRLMFGKSAFLMRSYTPLTAEWMDEMHRRLDAATQALVECSGGGIYGESADYPISWNDLLARVLDPLTLKHHEHVRYDDRILLDFTDYR